MENLFNLNKTMNLEMNRQLNVQVERNKNEFQNVVENVIDKGANYVIKAMPINDNMKDILIDVKNAFKTRDFKEIVKTAINSSLREGFEILMTPKNIIKDIIKIKDIAFKGGLREALSVGIDIVTNKYLKNNLFAPIINDFLGKTKEFLFSKAFDNKLDQGINKSIMKSDKYKELCSTWYDAYEKFDINNMNNIAKTLNSKKKEVIFDKDCVKENEAIQNMTELVNAKKAKLSKIQLQICSNL